MRRYLVILSAVILAAGTAQAADDLFKSPEELISALIKDMDEVQKSYEAAMSTRSSQDEQAKLERLHDRQRFETTEVLMAQARHFPWHPASIDAITWILTKGQPNWMQDEEALRLLISPHLSPSSIRAVNHLSDERIVPLCLALINQSPFEKVAPFYRTVMAKSENRRVRALAIYALAARSIRASRDIEKGLKDSSSSHRKGGIHYSEAEARRLASESDLLFQQLIDEYADVRLETDTLGEVAEAWLSARGFAVGQPAPEIDGVDASGKRFKLSDYHGKVVVVSFWAGWCLPCMELIPEERALVEHMKGKDFVLLGVNSDQTMERFQEVNENKQVSWRSWWDGPNRLISARWNVKDRPSLYVIDRKGVIRSDMFSLRDVREGKLAHLVDQLLREE